MKKFLWIFVVVFCLFLVACGEESKTVEEESGTPEVETHTVTFINTDGDTLAEVVVNDLESVTLPTFETEEGYYYDPDFSLGILEGVKEDLVLELKLRECQKTINYYKDGKLIRTYDVRYSTNPSTPSIDTSRMESYEWTRTIEKVENENRYLETYTLTYVPKTIYNITYYDGKEELGLSPSTYNNTVDTILPSYTKEGYEFAGWYLSDISLANFDTIPVGTEYDIKLYARWVEVTSHDTYTLPEASAHFTGVTYMDNVYAPKMPLGVKSVNALDYDWNFGDGTVLRCSTFSSFSIVKPGIALVTATLKSDPTYTINGLFKATVEKVVLTTVEDANKIETVTVTFKDKEGAVLSTQKVVKGSSAVLPTPPTVAGMAFAGWDHENVNITTDTIFTATYSDAIKNPYVGKTISIVGDSLSSFYSNIPSKYESFFPNPLADVNDVNYMWYMQVINKLGAKLFINDSYGGTCVQGGSEPTSSSSRLGTLVVNKHYADYTILYIGNNDCAASLKTNEYTVESFETYYRKMIDNLLAICPNTTPLLCTLGLSKLYDSTTQKNYNEVIRKLANEYGYQVIECETIDLTQTSEQKLLVDSGHPTVAGMNIVAKIVYKELTK